MVAALLPAPMPVLERRDGTVGLAEAQRVQFLDTAKEFAKYEEEETKDV